MFEQESTGLKTTIIQEMLMKCEQEHVVNRILIDSSLLKNISDFDLTNKLKNDGLKRGHLSKHRVTIY